jgi:uncharacterized protein (TIGR03032 family)
LTTTPSSLEKLWNGHQTLWRHPAQVVSAWPSAGAVSSDILSHKISGAWWDVLEELGITLLVTREYEHLVQAFSVVKSQPLATYLPLPHPSGVAVDRKTHDVYIASTRNPNQIFRFRPANGFFQRTDMAIPRSGDRPLMPVSSRFLPGCFYIHDLAFIDGKLFANSVGQNAVIDLSQKSDLKPAWWPRAIDSAKGPLFSKNALQLNSIAAGKDLKHSFFSASTDKVSSRRPGHKNFSGDKRGVIFSGATREPVGFGLTRPHSARFFRNRVWVDNSGYGELGFMEKERFHPIRKFPGWTRGLCFIGDTAFVGLSRVIPAYRNYAPGLDPSKSECGICAVDMKTNRIRGSIRWPRGNQIFAVDWIPNSVATGFPFAPGRRLAAPPRVPLFYSYKTMN